MNSSLKLFPAAIHNGAHVCDTETKVPIDAVTIIIRYIRLFAFNDNSAKRLGKNITVNLRLSHSKLNQISEEYCIVPKTVFSSSRTTALAIVVGIAVLAAVAVGMSIILRRKKVTKWNVPETLPRCENIKMPTPET